MAEAEELFELFNSINFERNDNPLFHYTSRESFSKMITDNGISFRLSEASKFDDKLEGKLCEVFYDIALEELVEEAFITESEREALEIIKLAKIPIMYNSDDINAMSLMQSTPLNECTIYVGCFSTEQFDTYMIQHYIKNPQRNGVCIEFTDFSHLISKTPHSGVYMTLKKVRYGIDAIQYLKQKTKDILSTTGKPGTSEFQNSGAGCIGLLLKNLSFTAKSGRYRKEHEYRLIMYVPNSIPKGRKIDAFPKDEKGLFIKIPNTHIANVYPIIKGEAQKELNYRNDLNGVTKIFGF